MYEFGDYFPIIWDAYRGYYRGPLCNAFGTRWLANGAVVMGDV